MGKFMITWRQKNAGNLTPSKLLKLLPMVSSCRKQNESIRSQVREIQMSAIFFGGLAGQASEPEIAMFARHEVKGSNRVGESLGPIWSTAMRSMTTTETITAATSAKMNTTLT